MKQINLSNLASGRMRKSQKINLGASKNKKTFIVYQMIEFGSPPTDKSPIIITHNMIKGMIYGNE